MERFTVMGCCDDKDLYFCRCILQKLASVSDNPPSIDFKAILEIDYIRKLEELRVSLGGAIYSHTATHLVLLNDQYLGDSSTLLRYCASEPGMEDTEPDLLENMQCATLETAKCLENISAAFLAFSSMDDSDESTEQPFVKKLTIELYKNVCPIACENFIKLCNGEAGMLHGTDVKLHYLNCPIHRIVPGGWLQCGDIVDGSGANSIAAIGIENKIHDENLSVDFSEKFGGIVGMCASATHSNGSQFFITLGPCPWMNHKFVGIGRVVRGFETLRKIEKEPTKNQKPIKVIYVNSCGMETNILKDFI